GARVDAGISLRALGCIAKRRLCYQAASVDGPEGDTGLDRGIDGGMHLGLVVDSIQSHTASKVDERLLFVELPEHFCSCLQCGELTVGIEDVQFAVALPEGRTCAEGAGGIH